MEEPVGKTSGVVPEKGREGARTYIPHFSVMIYRQFPQGISFEITIGRHLSRDLDRAAL